MTQTEFFLSKFREKEMKEVALETRVPQKKLEEKFRWNQFDLKTIERLVSVLKFTEEDIKYLFEECSHKRCRHEQT